MAINFEYYFEQGLLPSWILNCHECPISEVCNEYKNGREVRCGLGHSYNYLFDKFSLPKVKVEPPQDKRFYTTNITAETPICRVVLLEECNKEDLYNSLYMYKQSIDVGVKKQRLIYGNLFLSGNQLSKLYLINERLEGLEKDLFESIVSCKVLFIYDFDFILKGDFVSYFRELIVNRINNNRVTYIIIKREDLSYLKIFDNYLKYFFIMNQILQ